MRQQMRNNAHHSISNDLIRPTSCRLSSRLDLEVALDSVFRIGAQAS